VSRSPALLAAQRAVAILTIALIATQFLLAGAGAFGATSYDAHKTVGSVLVLVILVGLVVALVARRHPVHAAIVLGVAALQVALGALGEDTPWIGALHGLNAIAVMAAAGTLLRKVLVPPGATPA
jgi:hypothetical protein